MNEFNVQFQLYLTCESQPCLLACLLARAWHGHRDHGWMDTPKRTIPQKSSSSWLGRITINDKCHSLSISPCSPSSGLKTRAENKLQHPPRLTRIDEIYAIVLIEYVHCRTSQPCKGCILESSLLLIWAWVISADHIVCIGRIMTLHGEGAWVFIDSRFCDIVWWRSQESWFHALGWW